LCAVLEVFVSLLHFTTYMYIMYVLL
jgi:hypothetical protein